MFDSFCLFSGNLRKKVPKSINECTQPNLVTQTLWSFAKIAERIGVISFFVTVILGALSALITAIALADGVSFLIIFGSSFISGIVDFFFFRFIAVIVAALANITFNTSVSANVALYEHLESAEAQEKKEEEDAYRERIKKESAQWVCSKCGKTNYNFNEKCWSCETEKPRL